MEKNYITTCIVICTVNKLRGLLLRGSGGTSSMHGPDKKHVRKFSRENWEERFTWET